MLPNEPGQITAEPPIPARDKVTHWAGWWSSSVTARRGRTQDEFLTIVGDLASTLVSMVDQQARLS